MSCKIYAAAHPGIALVALGMVVPAFAEEDRSAQSGALEEVVVTAQRRTENAQSVAIAVTSLSSDDLEHKSVLRVDDLQLASPGLSVTDAGLTQNVNIRGIGLASGNPSIANGVATYVDGIFQPPIVTMGSFYDIANVEVLRGPQGTFVGSNSTGGAIFINTRSPTLSDFNGYAEVSAGNYSSKSIQGAVNLPINNTLAVRLSGNYRRHDSYYNDLGPLHNEPGGLDEQDGRFGLLWKPTGEFQALFKTEILAKQTGGYAYRPVPGTLYAPLRTAGIRDVAYDSATQNNENGLQNSLELRYQASNGVTFRSLSGYENKRIHNLYDLDGTIQPAQSTLYPRIAENQFVRERVWTQEINIISPTEGVWDWIVGGYYQRNRIDVNINEPTDGFNQDILINTHKQTVGVFAQTGYKLTDALKLDLGARYSQYKNSQTGGVTIGRGIAFPPFFGAGLQVADLGGGYQDGRATGKVALDWQVNANNLVYAFVARGYKPGGFNSASSTFNPETVLDYEVGWKPTFADGRVRLQLGAFWNDYHHFQLDALNVNDGQLEPRNIANATIKGFEAQIQAKLGAFGFDLGGSFVESSLSHAMFVNTRALPAPGATRLGPQCPVGTPSNPPVCFDYTGYYISESGGPNPYSPKWTFNSGVQYTLQLSSDTTLTPRMDYAYVGSQYTNLLYSPVTDLLPSRSLLSAQLALERRAWLVEAYGRNLANREYVTGQFNNNEFYGPPREYGLRASYRF